MKSVLLFVITFLVSAAHADDCSQQCSESCVRDAENTISDAREYLRACGARPDPRPPREETEVAIYKSDSCSDNLVAIIDSRYNCDLLRSERAWAVRINGVCSDITDIDADKACMAFQAASSPRAIKLYKSDSCSGDLLAYVDQRTDCEELGNSLSSNVWAVKIDNTCKDITDTSFTGACMSFQAAHSPDAVQLYRSDSCSDNLLAYIDRRTDCQALANRISGNVWAVRVNGTCQDISDTSFLQACRSFGGR